MSADPRSGKAPCTPTSPFTAAGEPYSRFSGADRGVNRLWWRRWNAEGMFCVVFSATDAYCEIDGPEGLSIYPRSSY